MPIFPHLLSALRASLRELCGKFLGPTSVRATACEAGGDGAPWRMARVRERDEDWAPALEALRAICLALPGVIETVSYGNPTFKAGRKTFAVLDAYQGSTCVWLACGAERRPALLEAEGFFAAPYDRNQTAVCRRAAGIAWPTFADLVREVYARAL